MDTGFPPARSLANDDTFHSMLGIAPRQVEIAAGEGARVKRLRIAGDPRMLDAMLERLTKGAA